MPVRIDIEKLYIRSLEHTGSGEDVLRGEVLFTASGPTKSVECNLPFALTQGGDLQKDPLEVGMQTAGLGIPFEPFRNQLENTFRGALGPTGWAVRFGNGVQLTMNECWIDFHRSFEVNVQHSVGW